MKTVNQEMINAIRKCVVKNAEEIIQTYEDGKSCFCPDDIESLAKAAKIIIELDEIVQTVTLGVNMCEVCEDKRNAPQIAMDYAGFDGAHHKMWVIDQMVRALCRTEEAYQLFVKAYEEPYVDEDGYEYDEYEWDTGIAP